MYVYQRIHMYMHTHMNTIYMPASEVSGLWSLLNGSLNGLLKADIEIGEKNDSPYIYECKYMHMYMYMYMYM